MAIHSGQSWHAVEDESPAQGSNEIGRIAKAETTGDFLKDYDEQLKSIWPQSKVMQVKAKDILNPKTFERALEMREPQSEDCVLGVDEILSPTTFEKALRMQDAQSPVLKLPARKHVGADNADGLTTQLSGLSLTSSTFTSYEKLGERVRQVYSWSNLDHDAAKDVQLAVMYAIPTVHRAAVAAFLDGYVGFVDRVPSAILLVDATSEYFSGSVLPTLWWDKHGENSMEYRTMRFNRM